MKHRPCLSLTLVSAVALAALLVSPASADRVRDRWRDAEPQGFAPAQAGEKRISLDEATRRAKRHTPGRVLNARERGDLYEVKVLTPGNEVVTVTVDAVSGEIVR